MKSIKNIVEYFADNTICDCVFDSIYDSVRDSVYDSVGGSVYDSVGGSVRFNQNQVRDSINEEY